MFFQVVVVIGAVSLHVEHALRLPGSCFLPGMALFLRMLLQRKNQLFETAVVRSESLRPLGAGTIGHFSNTCSNCIPSEISPSAQPQQKDHIVFDSISYGDNSEYGKDVERIPNTELLMGESCRRERGSLRWITSSSTLSFVHIRHYGGSRSLNFQPSLHRKRMAPKVGKEVENKLPITHSDREAPNLSRKRISQVGLSDETKSIILGSLLGDGSLRIHKDENDARFSFRHSRAHEEYFRWKVSAMKEISADALMHYGKNKKFIFQSQAINELTRIHNVTHYHNQLLIQRRWLNHLTPLSLAIWWCDEGSLVAAGRKGVLCMDGFDQKHVMLVAQYLEVAWKIYGHVGVMRRICRGKKDGEPEDIYRLWFRTEELKKLLRLLLPHIPVPSMLKKCMLFYNDPRLQQSWISEMKESLPQFSDCIDQELVNKKEARAQKKLTSQRLTAAASLENLL